METSLLNRTNQSVAGNASNSWARVEFTEDEWKLVKATWDKLVVESKIVRGQKPPVMKNFTTLIKALRKVNHDFKERFEQTLPSRSKKYKSLHAFIRRRSKATDGGEDESMATSQASNTFLFDPDDEDLDVLFDDQPSLHQSPLRSSFMDTPEYEQEPFS